MNKRLWSMTALALLLAGCSQNEVTDENVTSGTEKQISLEASTGKHTRATDATIKTLQDDTNGFKVFATKGATSVGFIDNKVYKYSSGKWNWNLALSDLPEWPAAGEYPVKFYAYYPAAEVTTSLSASSLTQEFTIKAVDQQIDLMAAKTEVTAKPATKRATLQFKHLFSKIAFKANVSEGIKANILSIAVKNVSEKRTFDFVAFTWNSDASSSMNYPYLAASASGGKYTAVSSGAATTITGDNNALMLMPQSLQANAWDANSQTPVDDAVTKAYVEVLYRLSDSGDTKDEIGFKAATSYPNGISTTSGWKDYTGPLFVRVGYSLKATETWNMGKAYTYVIQFPGTGGVSLDESFYDDKGKQTDLKVQFPGGGAIDPGQPPFKPADKEYIDFSVIVDSWGEPSDHELN